MSSSPPTQSLSSPTSGNTPPQVLPTPSSSTSVSLRQLNNNKQSQMKRDIEQQLVEKQKQLQESNSGIGKNVLARQVSQLEDRLKEMDTHNEELQPTSSVDRLRSMERDLTSSYRSHPLSPGISSIRNKEKLLNQRSPTHSTTSTVSAALDPLPSPTTSTLLPPPHGHDSTSMLPLPPPPTGSTPTKRRSKVPNTDRRNTDIEFATEIGQGLLLEVRKMQVLLQEKEEKLRTLENQKADLERAAEAMAKQMRQREENEEKLKEETWNLELAKQELVVSVTDLQSNLSKANAEQNKLAKQVNDLRSEIENLRGREEKLSATIDNMKQRHEHDMSSLRRHAAGIQREKSDQSKQIEALTSELAIAKAQSRISKHATIESDANLRRAEKEQTDGDQVKSTVAAKDESLPTASPPSSPKQSPIRNQAMEVETLKTSLAHAHRIISGLRSGFHKEKTEKFEFKKLLADSQETIEQLQNDPRMWVDAGPARNAGGSSSNPNARFEDGQLGGRRPHKASTSSTSKRRGKKTVDLRRSNSNKLVKSRTADIDDSVFSYSSVSDNEDSELDSFDESDLDTGNTTFGNKSSKKAAASLAGIGFTPLSSELSQSQAHKPVFVDAQMNTDAIDALPSLATVTKADTLKATRSLGDELGLAMSRSPSSAPENEEFTVKNVAGGLVTGAAAALGLGAILESDDKKAGAVMATQTEERASRATDASVQTDDEPVVSANEISTQTDSNELHQVTVDTVSIEPRQQMTLQDGTYIFANVEPEDSSIAVNALATAVAESRKAALEAAVDQQVQSESEDPSIAEAALATALLACRQKAFESAVDHGTQSEVEDPSIAKAATASAIAESRQLAFESAISQDTQCDPEDPSIHETAMASALLASRNAALESAIDQEIQCDAEDPAIAEAHLATAVLASRKEALDSAVHQETQSVAEDPSISEAAIAAAIIASRLASIESGVEQGTQSEAEDSSIAIAATATAIAASRKAAIESAISQETQFDAVAAVDHEIQCDSIVGTDCGVQSESEEQLKLADTALAASALALQQNSVDDQSEDALNALQNAPTSKGIKPEHKDLNETSDVITIAAATAAASNAVTLRSDDDIAAADEPKDERVFSKAETDALIASAVAMALANVAAPRNTSATDNQNADVLKCDPKRHTCDMSHYKNSSSSAPSHTNELIVASQSSGLVTRDNEKEPVTTEEDGNIVDQLSRPEDIASSASSHEKDQQKPELQDLLITEHYDQAPRNIESEQQVSKPRSLELSMGPLITHEKEPVEATADIIAAGAFNNYGENEDKEEDEIIDIPVRPANPPPAALLSRAALSPIFNERSMSPVSVRSSKGKAPYDSYSGLSSPTTNDNASRAEFNNRGSISASSMSTNNTNEQLQSISSSQYDASGRGSAGAGTTDPNTINLITQTMIGDWMYKYTRKAVGGGLSEKRHRRYFWIHPYTNTLYWSTSGPGGNGNGHEVKAKCALIENITAVQDYTSNTNGLPNVSLLIQTGQRQLKLTAPTMETHDRWLESITYLIARNANGTNPGLTLLNDSNRRGDNTMNARSISSATSGSLLNKAGFRRIHDLFQQPSGSTSARSTVTSIGTDHIELDGDDDDEALEDVRMCCNGKHHVSKLEKDRTQRRQYRKRKSRRDNPRGAVAAEA